MKWAVSDYGWRQGFALAVWLYEGSCSMCQSLIGIPVTVLQISGGQDFWQCWPEFTWVYALLLRCCFHINTLPNPGGCLFSPGLTFNIAITHRNAQRCAAVFSGISIWTSIRAGHRLDLNLENLWLEHWMWFVLGNSLNGTIGHSNVHSTDKYFPVFENAALLALPLSFLSCMLWLDIGQSFLGREEKYGSCPKGSCCQQMKLAPWLVQESY